jgi:hypothetical protein
MTLAACAFVAACGGSDGGALSVKQYFARLDALDDEAARRFDAASAALAANPPEGGEVAVYRAAIGAQNQVFEELLDALGGLAPPVKLEFEHEQYVDAIREVVRVSAEAEAQMAPYSSLAEANEALALDEVIAAQRRYGETCVALEVAAANDDIDLDLDCE